jgi:hypothetical protein
MACGTLAPVCTMEGGAPRRRSIESETSMKPKARGARLSIFFLNFCEPSDRRLVLSDRMADGQVVRGLRGQ